MAVAADAPAAEEAPRRRGCNCRGGPEKRERKNRQREDRQDGGGERDGMCEDSMRPTVPHTISLMGGMRSDRGIVALSPEAPTAT